MKSRKSLWPSLCLLLSILTGSISPALAQPKENFFAFDENWNGSEISKATYFLRIRQLNDTNWQWDYYNLSGPLLKTLHYRDKLADTAEGEFIFYNKKGRIDSILNFYRDLAQGTWYYYNDTGRVIRKKIYEQGVLKEDIDAIRQDSLDALKAERERKGEDPTEKESEFRGGLRSWQGYLSKNLEFPDRANQLHVSGTVVVQFIVDQEGKIRDPALYQSVEFSLDEEALRIIRDSPRWNPGVQRGRKVKTYKRQPISFKL